jgi:hypothetical protein
VKRGPIWTAVRTLGELAASWDATYIVVDSVVVACVGSDPLEPGTPARYAEAIEAIGKPVLSLAHVTKDGSLAYPFGSVFWHNLARVTWSLARDGERLLLVNRKANNYRNAGRLSVEVTWHDDLPREVWERPYSVALSDRIDEVLGDDALKPAEVHARLVEDSGEDDAAIQAATVRQALRRGIPSRYTVDNDGRYRKAA